jgi:hypothetical protein
MSVLLCVLFKMDINGVVGANNQLTESQEALVQTAYAMGSFAVAFMVLVIGYVINLIATRKFRRELKHNAMQQH